MKKIILIIVVIILKCGAYSQNSENKFTIGIMYNTVGNHLMVPGENSWPPDSTYYWQIEGSSDKIYKTTFLENYTIGDHNDLLHHFIIDGINGVQNGSPRHERMSWGTSKSFLNLLKNISVAHNNTVKWMLDCNTWYYPNVGNVYNINPNIGKPGVQIPNENDNQIPRTDYDKLINGVSQEAYYKYILGFTTSGEYAFIHYFNNTDDLYHSFFCKHYPDKREGNADNPLDQMMYTEMPLDNLDKANGDFREKYRTNNREFNIINMVANHNCSIHDGTDDYEWNSLDGKWEANPAWNPQDILTMTNQPDIILEGSYHYFGTKPIVSNYWFKKPYSNILNDGVINDNGHYLAKFKNVQYFKEKSNKPVHVQICTDISNQFRYFNLHTSESCMNANWFYLQAYGSIIHGAEGVWVYHYDIYNPCEKRDLIGLPETIGGPLWEEVSIKALEYYKKNCDKNANDPGIFLQPGSFELCEFDNNEACKRDAFRAAIHSIFNNKDYRFQEGYLADNYKNFIRPLIKELRILKEMDLLSSDSKSIIYNKFDSPDLYCIVPTATSYIKTFAYEKECEFPIDKSLVGVPESYIRSNYDEDTGNELMLEVNSGELHNENYGLRYSIRTNGSDVIMMICNPLNLPLINVKLDLSNIPNESIQNCEHVDMLFTNPATTIYPNVCSDNYKKDRTLIFDHFDRNAFDNIPHKDLFFEEVEYKTLYLNFGPCDVHILRFKSDKIESCLPNWFKEWTNNGSGRIGGTTVNKGQQFIKGDFEGDSYEDLLNIQDINNSWATLQIYQNHDWNTIWNNSGKGLLGYYENNVWHGWIINSNDKFVPGNFRPSSAKDELLCIQNITNDHFSAMLGYSSKGWNDWYWSNYYNANCIGPWRVSDLDIFISGNFDSKFGDELFCFNPVGKNYRVLQYNEYTNQWNSIASGYESNLNISFNLKSGNFVETGDNLDELLAIQEIYPFKISIYRVSDNRLIQLWSDNSTGSFSSLWNVSESDVILNTDINLIDRLSDKIDELILIENGIDSKKAKILSFDLSRNSWVNIWNNDICLGYIGDWQLKNGTSHYFDYQVYNLNIDNDLNTNLMGFKGIDYNSFYGCPPRYLINMYTIKDISLKNREISQEIEVDMQPEFKVYPNPSTGVINVEIVGKPEAIDVTLVNIYGQKIITDQIINKNSFTLNYESIESGIYILRFSTKNFNKEFKLIIQ